MCRDMCGGMLIEMCRGVCGCMCGGMCGDMCGGICRGMCACGYICVCQQLSGPIREASSVRDFERLPTRVCVVYTRHNT